MVARSDLNRGLSRSDKRKIDEATNVILRYVSVSQAPCWEIGGRRSTRITRLRRFYVERWYILLNVCLAGKKGLLKRRRNIDSSNAHLGTVTLT